MLFNIPHALISLAACPLAGLQEPWRSLMQKIYAKGIIVVRTAGNEGDPMGGQGLFYADGHTAPGALVVGGANTASNDLTNLGLSSFSSYGPVSAWRYFPALMAAC